MGFVVHNVALGQVCLLVLQFSPLCIILPTLRSRLYLRVALTRRTSGGKYGNLPESYALSEVGELWMEKFLVFKWLNSVIHGLCVYVCVCCKLTK